MHRNASLSFLWIFECRVIRYFLKPLLHAYSRDGILHVALYEDYLDLFAFPMHPYSIHCSARSILPSFSSSNEVLNFAIYYNDEMKLRTTMVFQKYRIKQTQRYRLRQVATTYWRFRSCTVVAWFYKINLGSAENGDTTLTALLCPIIVPLDVRLRYSRPSALQTLDEILYL